MRGHIHMACRELSAFVGERDSCFACRAAVEGRPRNSCVVCPPGGPGEEGEEGELVGEDWSAALLAKLPARCPLNEVSEAAAEGRRPGQASPSHPLHKDIEQGVPAKEEAAYVPALVGTCRAHGGVWHRCGLGPERQEEEEEEVVVVVVVDEV